MSKKSRKLIRAGGDAERPAPDAAVAASEPVDPFAPFADRDWGFHFLPEVETELVDERALHSLMKDWRHGRATRNLWQALGDAYYVIFSLLVIGAMAGNALLQAQSQSASCTTGACLTGRSLVPWGLLFATAALSLSLARIFGPVMASSAEGFWLFESPITRGRLLRPRLAGAVAGAFGVAAALAALVAALSGVPPVQLAGFALATGLTASALMAWAAVEQAAERRLPTRVGQAVFSLGGVAAIVVMVLTAAGRLSLPHPPELEAAPWVVAAVGAVVTVVMLVLALTRLERFRRARLQSGGALVSGMQGAMFALDLGLARDILVERDAIERGHVRPTRGRGTGAGALVWRDAQRLLRSPKPLVGLLAAMLVPYAADAVGLGAANPLVSGLALLVALVPLLGSLRVLSRTRGLARLFPLSTSQIRTATMAVPAVLAALWVVAAFPAFWGVITGVERDPLDALTVTLATGAAGLLGAVRWQTGGQVDYSAPLVATGTGAMPMSLLTNLFRGIDIVALVVLPLLFGVPPYVSLVIAVVVFAFLRAGMNTQEMQAQAAEEKTRLEAEKSAREQGSTRTKIPRPTR